MAQGSARLAAVAAGPGELPPGGPAPDLSLNGLVLLAQFHGIDYGWPRPDPIVQDFATREVAAEQPYIYRLTRLGIAATQRGRGLPFVDEVSQIIWNGKIDGWDSGSHLADATARAGLNLGDLDAEIENDPGKYDAIIEENQQALAAAGHT